MLGKLALSAALALGLAGSAYAETVNWTAKLDQAQEGDNKAPAPNAKGEAMGTLDTTSGAMTWTVTWDGLTGAAKAMHFHGPAPMGKNAGVLVDIGKISGLTSPSKGEATISPEQIKQVQDGMWYINIHTPSNPGGEIRGQVKVGM